MGGGRGHGSRGRPLEWPTDEPWPGSRPYRVQDPWATGTYYTRAQVESVLERERQKRRERPWLKPLAEGSVEDVMLQLAKDKAASDRVCRNYDLSRPVALYEFVAERDGRACQRCRQLDGRAWRPWKWRPPIPVHPGCRCRYTHRHPPAGGRAPFQPPRDPRAGAARRGRKSLPPLPRAREPLLGNMPELSDRRNPGLAPFDVQVADLVV